MSSQAEAQAAVSPEAPAHPEEKPRRNFLTKITGLVVGGGLLASAWPYLRSIVPNVLYEPPRRFKIGDPAGFPQGATFIEDRQLYVFRDGNAFWVVSGVCTHLGCTVKFSAAKNPVEATVRGHTYRSIGEFHCPCHGSKFRDEGTNFSGPAPRPLDWYRLELAPDDGSLLVNLAERVDRNFRLVV